MSLTGGGGTDMRRGIDQALAARPRPDLVVVLTDGETPWPARDPGTPIVVALLEEPHVPPPSWARVVHVTDDRPGKPGGCGPPYPVGLNSLH